MGRRAKEGFPEEVNETSRNIELVQEEKKKKKRMRVLLAKGMAYAKILGQDKGAGILTG